MTTAVAQMVRLDLPASHRHLAILSACIAEMLALSGRCGPQDPTVYATQLAAHETCVNIVEHAYGGRIDGRLAVTLTLVAPPERIEIEVYDTGHSFDPAAIPVPDLAQPRVGGYGLFLIRSLADEVTYIPGPNGNRWRLVKGL